MAGELRCDLLLFDATTTEKEQLRGLTMPIEDFFRPAEVPGNHPLLRFVASRVRAGDQPLFELDRPREVFGFQKATVVIHFMRNGQEIDSRSDDWDDDLNTGLILLGVKSATPDVEKDRFALGLRAALRRPERRYGDGYFNAVLVQFARQTDFRDHAEVRPILEHISHACPHEGRSYPDCRDMIDGAVKGRAVELTEQLGYQMHAAWDILAGALARYLDERFSVTNRRLLNLL